MTPRALARLLLAYAITLTLACLALHQHATLRELAPTERRTILSRWSNGELIDRTTTAPGEAPASAPAAPPSTSTSTLVHETTTAEGPLSLDARTFPFALVAGRDGLFAELDGRTTYVTVDDLLSAQAYDHASTFLDPSLGLGTHRATVLALLSTRLGAPAADVAERAHVKRVRFERSLPDLAPTPRVTTSALDREDIRARVHAAATYLARSVDDTGRYRYLVDPIKDVALGGYSWPRHAGTTYFLAQAAALLDDAEVRYASLRAAALLRDDMMQPCGTQRCIADDAVADVGSAALALVAFTEIVRTGADPSYRRAAIDLALFLRSQQRPDGELMHEFDREKNKPVDVQRLYFTGEAALALSRAHRMTGDPEDLRAASRALSRLSGHGWSFFGSRYYFSEEHWTCQAMSDLWDRAPDAEALAFCLRWHEYQRALQHDAVDSPFDADGSFGFGPFVTPRVTPASSRGEAAAAALDVMRRDPRAGNMDDTEHARSVAFLDDELRRAIAFVARAQIRPELWHLFAHPDRVTGAFPGSAVDLQLRIDYVQHAGSMMIRWLELDSASRAHP